MKIIVLFYVQPHMYRVHIHIIPNTISNRQWMINVAYGFVFLLNRRIELLNTVSIMKGHCKVFKYMFALVRPVWFLYIRLGRLVLQNYVKKKMRYRRWTFYHRCYWYSYSNHSLNFIIFHWVSSRIMNSFEFEFVFFFFFY